MRISDWSSDVCSSDLQRIHRVYHVRRQAGGFGPLRGRRHSSGPGSEPLVIGDIAMSITAERKTALVQEYGTHEGDRKSVVWGKRVSVRLDLGGRRIFKKNKIHNIHNQKRL